MKQKPPQSGKALVANLVLSPGHSTLAERWMDLQIILLAARTCFLDRDPLIVDTPPHGCSLANSDRDKVHAFDRPTWRSPSSGAESAVLPSVRPSYVGREYTDSARSKTGFFRICLPRAGLSDAPLLKDGTK